jgi:hypothetical protein
LESTFINFRELYPDLLYWNTLLQLIGPIKDDVDLPGGLLGLNGLKC